MNVGEDILSTLIAVGLILVFIFSLSESYLNYRQSQDEEKESNLLLSISDFLRSSFSNSKNGSGLGVLRENELSNQLPQFVKRLSREGVKAKVEIVDFRNNSLFDYPEGNKDFAQSMTFPIIYEDGSKRIPARMVVWIGESFARR